MYKYQCCSWSAQQGKGIFPVLVRVLEHGLARRVAAAPSSVSLLISTRRLNLVLIYGIPPGFCDGVHLFIFPLYGIGAVPSVTGHVIAYRWRSLPRVRRHRARKAQDSSKRALPWQVTMDQLMCAALSIGVPAYGRTR